MSVFKDDQNRWRTRSLFLEMNPDESKYKSLFTLGDEDKDGRISVRKVYMNADDPTEYIVASSLFGGMELWNHLISLDWFKSYVDLWREELHAKIRAEAIQVVRETAETGDPSAAQLNAAKWLATLEWDGNKPAKETAKRVGRPPKHNPEQKLNEALKDLETEKDFLRLIKGKKD